MTKLTALRRGLITVIAVLAAATALGVAAAPAGATVTFADQTYAQTWSGTCNSGIHEMAFNVFFGGSGTVWERVWVYDLATGQYTLAQPLEEMYSNRTHYLRYPSFRGDLAVLVEFYRWVGYWDRKFEWVVFQSGGVYGQGFYYCPMP